MFDEELVKKESLDDSILLSVKKVCGISDEDDSFNRDIVIAINSSFFTLCQLGVGPKIPFCIKGSEETFSDFLGEEDPRIPAICQYICLKTRFIFDPPSSGFVLEAMKELIRELEYRLLLTEDAPFKNDWEKGDKDSK